MAEVNTERQQQEEQQTTSVERLKYLEFVQLAAIHVLLCFARLYDIAKENSGPLRPGVQTVEGTVKAVVGPVYDKFHCVPYEVLKFADQKVDDSVNKLEYHFSSLVQQVSTKACDVVNKVPEVARSVTSEAQRARVVDAATGMAKVVVAKCEPTSKELYVKYEPVVEHYVVMGWRSLNKLPFFAQAAHIVVPTAAHLSDKYNDAVCMGREKGYAVAAYLPPVPVDKIAKVFGPPDAVNM